MRVERSVWLSLLLVVGSVFVAGCASSSLVKEHSLYISEDSELAESEVATLYILRPRSERSRGIADKAVEVKLKGATLISMSKGEYTRIRVKPYRGVLTVASLTMFAAEITPREVTRSVTVKFDSGQTYFIHLHELNEEFRGVYTIPQLTDLSTAKQLIEHMDPIGEAVLFPIDQL